MSSTGLFSLFYLAIDKPRRFYFETAGKEMHFRRDETVGYNPGNPIVLHTCARLSLSVCSTRVGFKLNCGWQMLCGERSRDGDGGVQNIRIINEKKKIGIISWRVSHVKRAINKYKYIYFFFLRFPKPPAILKYGLNRYCDYDYYNINTVRFLRPLTGAL